MVLRMMMSLLLLIGVRNPAARASRLDGEDVKTNNSGERMDQGKDKPWAPGSEASEFIRQHNFLVSGEGLGLQKADGKNYSSRWVVLTFTQVLIYRCAPTCPIHPFAVETDNSGCKYPDNGVPRWWIDVDTVELGTITEYSEATFFHPNIDLGCPSGQWPYIKYCLKLAGLGGESREKVSVNLCDLDENLLHTWRNKIEQMFLNYHGIKGHLIDQKVRDAVGIIENERHQLQHEEFGYYDTEQLPDAMAPMLCMSDIKKAGAARFKNVFSKELDGKSNEAHLDVLLKFTEGQAVPFKPGKNSRSKAKFFFSVDGSMIAKMIRVEEYITLWGMVGDCSYSQRLTENGEGKSSLLNPILLAFMDEGQYWIIIRGEYLPQIIAGKLPPKGSSWRHDFHKDIKPGNMVSDREELAREVMFQRMLTGLQMTGALDDVVARLEKDVDYLASKKLMDYSLLVFGSFIELDHHDAGSQDFFSPVVSGGALSNSAVNSVNAERSANLALKQALQQAVGLAPQCGMACSDRPRKLVDITGQLQKASDSHYVWSGKSYRCCCVELKPGDSALINSPCALVQLSDEGGKVDCGGLLGSRFHAYQRASVGGRCLVDWDQWPETAGLLFLSGREVHDGAVLLKAQKLPTWQHRTFAPRVEACAVMCVSVADYLLQSSTWKEVENVALIPVYRGRKWSAYDTRTLRLLRCLMGGQPPTEPQSVDKKRAGLLRLFLSENRPPSPNELAWKECKNDFPEVRVLDDMKVVEKLVQIKL